MPRTPKFQDVPMSINKRTMALKTLHTILSGASMDEPRTRPRMLDGGVMEVTRNEPELQAMVEKLVAQNFLRRVLVPTASGRPNKRSFFLLTLGGMSYMRRIGATLDAQNELIRELHPESAETWSLSELADVA